MDNDDDKMQVNLWPQICQLPVGRHLTPVAVFQTGPRVRGLRQPAPLSRTEDSQATLCRG